MPDDFDAMTETRGSPTVLHAPRGADGSELDIDYDDVTVAPGILLDVPPSPTVVTERPRHVSEHILSSKRGKDKDKDIEPVSPPHRSPSKSSQIRRRTGSPSRSLDQLGFSHIGSSDPYTMRGKAASVSGGPAHPRTPRLSQKGPLPPSHLVPRKVIEDGPERTITIWREDVAASADAAESETRSDMDSHTGRRRGSISSQNKPDGVPISAAANSGERHRDRIMRRSIDITLSQSPRSSLNRSHSNASSPPTTSFTSTPSGSQPRSPRKHPLSSTGPPPELAPSLERVLASCEPPLTHLGPVLAALGVRQDEHLRALARMGAETRDREVREDALRAGVTVVEWAILIDRLKTL
ncbi:hypothetical protein K488DRAFT_82006 [Vararia minispora EC-137]|uniref:Uncharacterized protein n=1 Tax=Vararia minispora EC-137 TaxID=1314806 RepID=A0ACB8QXL6_9AGAM|nr:hypothetical protein K488DRAFT_82006 [Vararia minispora EC-137]